MEGPGFRFAAVARLERSERQRLLRGGVEGVVACRLFQSGIRIPLAMVS